MAPGSKPRRMSERGRLTAILKKEQGITAGRFVKANRAAKAGRFAPVFVLRKMLIQQQLGKMGKEIEEQVLKGKSRGQLQKTGEGAFARESAEKEMRNLEGAKYDASLEIELLEVAHEEMKKEVMDAHKRKDMARTPEEREKCQGIMRDLETKTAEMIGDLNKKKAEMAELLKKEAKIKAEQNQKDAGRREGAITALKFGGQQSGKLKEVVDKRNKELAEKESWREEMEGIDWNRPEIDFLQWILESRISDLKRHGQEAERYAKLHGEHPKDSYWKEQLEQYREYERGGIKGIREVVRKARETLREADEKKPMPAASGKSSEEMIRELKKKDFFPTVRGSVRETDKEYLPPGGRAKKTDSETERYYPLGERAAKKPGFFERRRQKKQMKAEKSKVADEQSKTAYKAYRKLTAGEFSEIMLNIKKMNISQVEKDKLMKKARDDFLKQRKVMLPFG